MNVFLFLLIDFKNKILHPLLPCQMVLNDNLKNDNLKNDNLKNDNLKNDNLKNDNLKNSDFTHGYDNRNNFSIKEQYILEDYILNSHKYELLQKLQTTNLSMLDKLYYIEKENTYYNTHLYTYALDIQNLLVGRLQQEFHAFGV